EGEDDGGRADDVVGVLVEGGEAHVRRAPGVVDDGDDVIEAIPGDGLEDLDFVRAADEGALGEIGRVAGVGVGAVGDFALDVEVKLVGCAGAGGAAAVDPELFEVPFAVFDVGEGGGPCSVGRGLKALDFSAAGEDGSGFGGGLVDDWGFGRAT